MKAIGVYLRSYAQTNCHLSWGTFTYHSHNI